jgi:hypothetical protein
MGRRAAFIPVVVSIVTLAGQHAAAQSGPDRWAAPVVPFDIVAVMDGTDAVKGKDVDVYYEDGSGTSLLRYDVLTSRPQLGIAFRF